jgi:hypothetical protein
MAVNPKPFSRDERLYKSTFKGSPNIFSAQDLNRYFDSVKDYQELLSIGLGATRSNFNIDLTNWTTAAPVPAVPGFVLWEFDWEMVKEDPLQSSIVTYGGTTFNLDSITGVTSESILMPTILGSMAYLCLVATKETVQHTSTPPVLHIADPAAFSGVQGTSVGLGTSFDLPSADNIVYGNERIVAINDPNAITLGVNEEYICIIATYGPRARWSPTFTVDWTGGTVSDLQLLYNAGKSSDFIDMTPAAVLNGGTLQAPTLLTLPVTFSNGGLIDAAMWMWNLIYSGQSLQDSLIAGLDTVTTTLVADLAALDVRVTANEVSIAANVVSINNTVAITGGNTSTVALHTLQIGDLNSITTLNGAQIGTNTTNITTITNTLSFDTWHEVGDVTTGLGTTFVDYENLVGFRQLRFKETHDKTIVVEGFVSKLVLIGAGGSNHVFTLPAGYRPIFDFRGTVDGLMVFNVSGSAWYEGPIQVQVSASSGVVRLDAYNMWDLAVIHGVAGGVCADNVHMNFRFSNF